ncbi:MAG: trigger factor, partial [Rhodobacteraceae bacterium]|nr:trigger factor [Paracoccaceae bacterium]
MQVTETLNEGLKRGYSIIISANELNETVEQKLREAQPEVEMKGFRKGKVPIPLLKKQFGQRLMGEAMQESIDGAMTKHFEDSGDRPAMQPDVKMANGEEWKPGDDISIEMAYDALPEIPELDLKSIKLEKMVAKIEKSAVNEALTNLAESSKDFEERGKTSKSKDGDQVVLDFVGKVDGEIFEGGSAEDYPLVLGSNSFIPGFEEQLLGSKLDQEIEVSVTFPEEYGNADLASKSAVFKCKIKAVKKPVSAKIDDALAEKFGAENLDGLKKQISERLEAEYEDAARSLVKRKLLDTLDGMVDFSLPPSLVEAEGKQIANQLWQEDNPDAKDQDPDKIDITKEHTDLATRRVRLGLLLADLGQKANVEVSEQEITQAMMQQARQYPGQ